MGARGGEQRGHDYRGGVPNISGNVCGGGEATDLEDWKILGKYVGGQGEGGDAARQFLEWVEAGGWRTRKGDTRKSIGCVRFSKGEEDKVATDATAASLGQYVSMRGHRHGAFLVHPIRGDHRDRDAAGRPRQKWAAEIMLPDRVEQDGRRWVLTILACHAGDRPDVGHWVCYRKQAGGGIWRCDDELSL